MAFEINRTIQQLGSSLLGIMAATVSTIDVGKPQAVTQILASLAPELLQLDKLIESVYDQKTPITCTGEQLDFWGTLKSTPRKRASSSAGFLIITGVSGATVPANTFFTVNGVEYKNIASQALSTVTTPFTSVAIQDSIATLTGVSTANLATGMTVTVSGSSITAVNGVKKIAVLSPTSISFSVTASNLSTMTFASTVTYVGASIPVISTDVGEITNQPAYSPVELVDELTNVDSKGFVGVGALVGGSEEETDDLYRRRVIQAWQANTALFDPDTIADLVLRAPNVEQAIVARTTPNVGDVTVYVLKAGSGSFTPTELNDMRETVFTIAPPNTPIESIYIEPVTPVVVDITIQDVVPNTPSMKAAIVSEIEALLASIKIPNRDLLKEAVEAAIYSAVDYSSINLEESISGIAYNKIESATLVSPSSNVVISPNQIAVLGTVTFI